ncbi:MAG: T9SS type A sorting domain-containing protein, partial [Candidatus Cloacimonetes bacterium]|nr:T9SS type A sorting domain-containing protein [Candidatus Cloacimonadota bacterium]
LTHGENSIIEFTQPITIPAGASFENLDLSAPGIYYLEGDITVVQNLILGPNTYIYTNGHELEYDFCEDEDEPRIIIDVPVVLASTAHNYNGFTARWDSVPGAASYDLTVNGPNGYEYNVGNITNIAARIDGLYSTSEYTYQIKAKDVAGVDIPGFIPMTETATTTAPIEGIGASTSINGAPATIFVPPVNNGITYNDVIVKPNTSGNDDFCITITYHPDGYDGMLNGRLLATVTSSNPSALNGIYTIHHTGMVQPAAAAYRYAEGAWIQLSDANFTVSGSTTVTISGINSSKTSGELQILMDNSSGTLPVELSSFTARINPYGNVKIEWVTQTETNVMGYRIYRNNVRNLDSAILLDALIEARNTSHTQVYSYTDNDVLTPGNHYYWLECIDFDGTTEYYGPVTVKISGDSDSHNQAPIVAGINHTYPNPFNPVVHIAYGVPEASTVKMNIYNVKGQYVSEIMNEYKNIGAHTFTWTGKDAYGRQLPSGLYFLRMEMNNKTWVKKITMSK